MKKEYNIGDKVWWAKYQQQSVRKNCPICSGTMRVTVILGNGDHVETDCTYCERGFERYGWVEEYEYVSAVELVNITDKIVTEDLSGKNIEYRCDHWILKQGRDFFDTKDEAEEGLKQKIAESKKEDLERLEYSKKNNPRKYSWHVGYYMRLKNTAIKEIERCDEKIAYFKKNVKSSPDKEE